MDKKIVKIAICLILCMMLFSTSALAATFTDIKGHWAESYINNMANEGIITGFSDNTFRPDDSVTYAQAFVMMARMSGASELEKTQIYNTKVDFLKEIDTSKGYEWAYKELAMMLALDVIDEDALTYFFMSKKIGKNAKKEEIAFYLAKAMLLEDEVKALKTYSLTYTDTPLIVDTYKPYIYLLTKKGILTGNNNKIEPQSEVNRAVFSAMLSKSLEQYPKIDFTKYLPNLISVEGVVNDIVDGTKDYIKIEKADGRIVTYQVNNDTDITLEGVSSNLSSLKDGMSVECKIDEDGIALQIEAANPLESLKGTVDYVGYENPQALGIIVTDAQNKKTSTRMGVNATADITLDGEKVSLKDLEKEDEVTVYFKDNIIYKITARSRIQDYKGEIKNIEYGDTVIIKIINDEGNLQEFDLTAEIKSIDITRNATKTSIDRLRNGDSVKITTDYDVVTDIVATAPKSEQTGIITEMVIGPTIKIKLMDANVEKVYTVNEDVDIRISEERASIYDLRLGYEVQISIEGTDIVYLSTTGEQPKQEITGKVVYVDTKSNIAMLSITGSDGNTSMKNIYVQSGTRIFDMYGDYKGLGEIKAGMEIIVIGNYDGGVFRTLSIIIK